MVLRVPLSQRGPYAYVYARGWRGALHKVKPNAAPLCLVCQRSAFNCATIRSFASVAAWVAPTR